MFEIKIESKLNLRKKDYLSKHGEWEHPNLKLRLCNYYPAELFQGKNALHLQFLLFVDTKTAQVLKSFFVKVMDFFYSNQWWLIYCVI